MYMCVYICILAILEERGKRYEVHDLKREVVISLGLMPETLVNPALWPHYNKPHWSDMTYVTNDSRH